MKTKLIKFSLSRKWVACYTVAVIRTPSSMGSTYFNDRITHLAASHISHFHDAAVERCGEEYTNIETCLTYT